MALGLDPGTDILLVTKDQRQENIWCLPGCGKCPMEVREQGMVVRCVFQGESPC